MWLLTPEIRDRILQAEQAGLMPTVEQQAELVARHEMALAGALPSIMSVAGDKAQIEIKGILSNTPNFLAMLFGGGNTTYPEIISALGAAESDDTISDITLAIDSPGGNIDGLFDVLNSIAKAEKPIIAVISNMGASAAFAIATQADEIIASNQAARIGSIGIAASILISENKVTIASTDAPKKEPNVETPEGVAIVREELDSLHQLFVEAIAVGRSNATGKTFSVADINTNFGQGATLVARDALKREMIDGIAQEGPQLVSSSNSASASAIKGSLEGEQVEITAGATPPFKDYPIENRAWNADAAVRRWRKHTNSTEKPSATYKNGFFWYDTEEPDKFGSYKLPFVDIVDGRIKAIRRGVFAANGAMSGARGQRVRIPAADRPKVQRHIDRYRDKIEKENERQTNNRGGRVMDLSMLKVEHSAVFAEAVEVGIKQERDRVVAHLIMGAQSGAMDTAIKAVKEGSDMSLTMSAEYLSAGMKNKDVDTRSADEIAATEALAAGAGVPDKDAADTVADAVCKALDFNESVVEGS